MSEQKYGKPLPNPSPETQRFWQGLKAHELWLPYCRVCEKCYWYPRDFCPNCGTRDVEWRRSEGRGRIYTFAIQYRAWHPGWANETPYITTMIDLDEGVRIFSNLIGVEPEPQNIKCDSPVEAVFEDVTDGITLLKFRPVSS
jgi:uncharacterized OB-fold protein